MFCDLYVCRHNLEVFFFNFCKGINKLILTLLVHWNVLKYSDLILTRRLHKTLIYIFFLNKYQNQTRRCLTGFRRGRDIFTKPVISQKQVLSIGHFFCSINVRRNYVIVCTLFKLTTFVRFCDRQVQRFSL